MFDTIETYNGSMVVAQVQKDGTMITTDVPQRVSTTTDQTMDDARAQAEQIIETARVHGEELKAAKLEEADKQAELMIGQKVNQAFTDLGLDLWSARMAIGDIVNQSLDAMIGKIGVEEATYRVVEKAIQKYASQKELTVYGDAAAISRLKLVAIGTAKAALSPKLTFKEDTALEPGRCILETDDKKRIDISLETQLAAMKRVAVNAVQDSAHRLISSSLSDGGAH